MGNSMGLPDRFHARELSDRGLERPVAGSNGARGERERKMVLTGGRKKPYLVANARRLT